ncbi:ATP-binding protein [Kineococcus radiotolerans]|uniref:Transcriptional regulator n=1 Tax=Kineococcus radiotolerans (strain ATCC BAA-149 / DSM 14245 / SRS30216) TaxID=266940 RepID=A6W4W1_KINRD|nr:ATP-binding protein [Kineococcus radiotolerans]ABS01850.1 putative transcriptional regulator [Kineococcus radiotolerans SRS30216 = ATCC BAA-149]
MTLSFGPDPVGEEVRRVLMVLDSATGPVRGLESLHVDLKEEAGRRKGPTILPGATENDRAARVLAGEAACMANTPGGGVLVVGVADDGTLIGTELDAQWLRRKIYDLTDRRLTADVTPVLCRGVRLLLVRSPEAVHPVMYDHKYHHRVADSCVEVDATTWEEQRRRRSGWDWSAQDSGLALDAARSTALQRARDFLTAAGEEKNLDLAAASDSDLLRRLNVVTPAGTLTNAGVIAFVGRDVPGIDYVRREVAGGDSLQRIREAGRGLLEELYEVDRAIEASNPVRHLPRGLVNRQVRSLPPRAAREALVNGVAHRDWSTVDPVHVEHIGSRLVVTSPGGFIGGITSRNIITHPSQPRNRALADLLARLRVAELEGIGVDRMVGDMIRLGHPAPSIEEVPGPLVRAVLIGTRLDEGWMAFLHELDPARTANDLDALLVVQHLVSHWWIDARVAAPLIQRSSAEAEDVLHRLEDVQVAGVPLTAGVAGSPANEPPAWTITPAALAVLADRDERLGAPQRRRPSRSAIARSWAEHRGRISSSELAGIVGAHPTNLQRVLKDLEAEGVLAPGREVRRGAGFFYVPTGGPRRTT